MMFIICWFAQVFTKQHLFCTLYSCVMDRARSRSPAGGGGGGDKGKGKGKGKGKADHLDSWTIWALGRLRVPWAKVRDWDPMLWQIHCNGSGNTPLLFEYLWNHSGGFRFHFAERVNSRIED